MKDYKNFKATKKSIFDKKIINFLFMLAVFAPITFVDNLSSIEVLIFSALYGIGAIALWRLTQC
jgi:hypothetical protein